jgi:hypothetical protein
MQNSYPDYRTDETVQAEESAAPAAENSKKPFVEPSITAPQNVLKAISFFQVETTVDTSDA